MNDATTVIHSVRLLSAGVDRPGAFVAFAGGRVLNTGHGADWRGMVNAGTEVVDGAGRVLAPGFIDIHNHGGAGASYDGGADAIRIASALHRRHGTTRLVLSLVTAPVDVLVDQVREMAAQVRVEPQLLGIHLEGPFLAPERRGAHEPALLRDPEPQPVRELLAAAEGTLRQVTLAPERAHFDEAARLLRDADVVVAVGHTAATYEQTRHAIDLGARLLTHAFNAMNGIHHRAPGPLLAFIDDPGTWLEVINDGVHVRTEVVRMLCHLAPGRVAFVTDAMAAAGAGDGRYRLGGLDVDVVAGVARLAGADAIAGSTLTLDTAVARAVRDVGLNPLSAIEAATAIPAQILGLGDRFGRLEPGFPADAVLLDKDWQVRAVWLDGRQEPTAPLVAAART